VNNLSPPTVSTHTDTPEPVDSTLILRLITTVEQLLTAQQTAAELELKCFTPEQAAPLLGKTPNWVIESIQGRRIPFTYVGKSPRLTAAHIRQIQAQGEVLPSKYAKTLAA
jgi:hypothetical protein